MTAITELDTPSLILNRKKLEANIAFCKKRARQLGVTWRPHVKTHKCAEVSRMQLDDHTGPITVSTVKEAEFFFEAGIRDMIYAVGIAPHKLSRIDAINRKGADVKIILDNIASAQVVSDYCCTHSTSFSVLIEVDCDGHRSGLKPSDPALVETAKALTDGASFAGVLTHAGDSYAEDTPEGLDRCARGELEAINTTVRMLAAAGFVSKIVSVGSTPTFAVCKSAEGVTEYRSGVGTFGDLFMTNVGVCKTEEIALSVQVCVIGHQLEKNWIITDGGWLAMSRDRGTASQKTDYGYGAVCDAAGNVLAGYWMKSANQEHGIICRRDGTPINPNEFPIGTRLRILPNHACSTAAAFDKYYLTDDDETVSAVWTRINNW